MYVFEVRGNQWRVDVYAAGVPIEVRRAIVERLSTRRSAA